MTNDIDEMELGISRAQGFSAAVLLSTIALALILLLIAGCEKPAHAEKIDMGIIQKIESGGERNPDLAHNKKDDSRGRFQIRVLLIKDWNTYHPKKQYNADDLWKRLVNEEIAHWYFNHIPKMLRANKIPVTTLTKIATYNWGIGNVVKWYRKGADFNKLPKITRDYYERYVYLQKL